jgi:PAS domain-containing protein
MYWFTALSMCASGFFASEPKGHSCRFRIAPDSFVYVRTIEQGNVVRWYGINADNDDRECAEQKLQEDDRDLRAIADAIPQPIVALAPDGTTLYANQVALERTGLTVRETGASCRLVRR